VQKPDDLLFKRWCHVCASHGWHFPWSRFISNKIDNYNDIQSGIFELLEASKRYAARSVNAIMTATYWEIGRRIIEFEQSSAERAGYGDVLIERLAKDLTLRFGRGFSHQNLWQMRAFFLAWPPGAKDRVIGTKTESSTILQTPSGEMSEMRGINSPPSSNFDITHIANRFPLPWSAYVRLLSVKNVVARRFYEAEALRAGWSVRQLSRQVNSAFYERTALSKNTVDMLDNADHTSPEDVITPEEAIKDPFILEFLDLKDEYSESDFENALILHLTDFLLELGDDFAFVGRQRRLRLDDTWFRIDLLFFHRRLKSLIVIDLKTSKLSYADAGQMHLYLNYAREHWMKPGENPPVGLILCSAKGVDEAHYALDNLPNKVLAAEYQIVLPDEKLLAKELKRSRDALEIRRAHKNGVFAHHKPKAGR